MLMDDAGKCERLAQRSSTREMHVDEREQQRGSFPPQARELRVDNKRVETQGPSNQAQLLFPGCVFVHAKRAQFHINGVVPIAAARAAAAVLLG